MLDFTWCELKTNPLIIGLLPQIFFTLQLRTLSSHVNRDDNFKAKKNMAIMIGFEMSIDFNK